MKSYAIFDEELKRNEPLGYLFYYEKANAFIIELCEDLDEWEAPLLFQGLVREKRYTVPKDIALLWVRERVIPSGRQNIGLIMKNARIKEYSEMALLSLSSGKCSQDSCYIKEVDYAAIPATIQQRSLLNVSECFPSEDRQIICMFRDNTVRKVNLTRLKDRNVSYVLKNDALFYSVKVGVGGYSIVFDGSIEIPASALRKEGILVPLSTSDFINFVRVNTVDTTKACDMIQCSRQNIAYLVKTKKIVPIKTGTKENLYTKGAIEEIMNE